MEYYKSDNYNFTKNGDIKLQPTDGKLRLELNTGLNELEFEIPYDQQKRWKKVDEWGVVKTKVFYSKNKQLYRIYNIEKGMFGLKIKARHIFFDLVKQNILDKRAVNCNGQEALNIILSDTKYIGHSDIRIMLNCYFEVTNIVQAINGESDNTFRNRWGGEMLLDNFDIYINKRIGGDYGVKVNYSRNMEDVNLIIDRDNIVTRAYPRAFDGIMLPEKYIDSPLINKYPIICEDYIDMSDLKLKDSINSDDEGFDTEEELYEAMRDRMKNLYESGIDKPKVSGNVKLAMLENSIEYKDFKGLVNVGIGDTVTVKHKDIDIDMKTRAIVIEWNLVTEKYENVEFGDVEINYFAKQDIAREQLENILNNNGTINGAKLEGIIDAIKSPIIAQKTMAKNLDSVAWKMEVLDPNDKNFGCIQAGTKGILLSDKRTLDDKDWNYTTAISPKGIVADLLIGKMLAGSGAYFDLNHGEIYFNKGLIKGENSEWNLNTGEFKSKLDDGSEIIISPKDGFYNKFGESKTGYHHLSYKTFATVPTNQGDLVIQLPSEFKNKKFIVLASPVTAVVDSFKPTEALRNVGIAVDVDYKNAIIRPASNYEYIDFETKKTRQVKCWANILVVA